MGYESRFAELRKKMDDEAKVEESSVPEGAEEAFGRIKSYCKKNRKSGGLEGMAALAGYVLAEDAKDYDKFLNELDGALDVIDGYTGTHVPEGGHRSYDLNVNDNTVQLLELCSCIGDDVFEYCRKKKSRNSPALRELFNYIVSCKMPALPEPVPDGKTIADSIRPAGFTKERFLMDIAKEHYLPMLKETMQKRLVGLMKNRRVLGSCSKTQADDIRKMLTTKLRREETRAEFYDGLLAVLMFCDDIKDDPAVMMGTLGALDEFFQKYVFGTPPKGAYLDSVCIDGHETLALIDNEIRKHGYYLEHMEQLCAQVFGCDFKLLDNMRRKSDVSELEKAEAITEYYKLHSGKKSFVVDCTLYESLVREKFIQIISRTAENARKKK